MSSFRSYYPICIITILPCQALSRDNEIKQFTRDIDMPGWRVIPKPFLDFRQGLGSLKSLGLACPRSGHERTPYLAINLHYDDYLLRDELRFVILRPALSVNGISMPKQVPELFGHVRGEGSE